MTIDWRLPSGESTEAAIASLSSSALFGGSAPTRFIVRRFPDGDLAKSADQLAGRVRGAEFSDTVTLIDDNMRGDLDTGQIAPYSQFSGPKSAASWLPDDAAARGWQAIFGVK
jgi:hypothetical protein